MVSLYVFIVLSLVTSGMADAQETKVLPTDKYGQVRHNKTSYTVEADGRIVVTDPYGNKQYHQPGFKVDGNRVYHADANGQIQHDKPSYSREPSGRIIPTDSYGNKLNHRPGFKTVGRKVYATDKYGNKQQQTMVVKPSAEPTKSRHAEPTSKPNSASRTDQVRKD